MTEGRCNGTDPELFHPDASPVMKLAVQVCEDCPVKRKCLAHAMAHMSTENLDEYPIGHYGVWGGTTPGERFRMLGRRAARYAA